MFEHVLHESTYKKIKLAYNDFGVWPEMYVKAYNRAEEIAFENGKTSINQSHATEALGDMDLTNSQKAIIWAFITKGKSNPFSAEQGSRVLAALDKLSK